jgi:hypothetical protein
MPRCRIEGRKIWGKNHLKMPEKLGCEKYVSKYGTWQSGKEQINKDRTEERSCCMNILLI